MGTFVTHTSCEACGSSDANGIYEDGTTYCHSCKAYGRGEGSPVKGTRVNTATDWTPATGTYQELTDRKIKADICKKYGYQIGEKNGVKVHIANFRGADGTLVAQKIRGAGKTFSINGDGKDMPLFGQHLWNEGKSVVITEGEIDAMAVGQAFDGKWAAVSIPNGASAALKAVQNAHEWLSGFEKIVICFDQDEPGRKATQEVCEALPVGKAYTMTLARKDASDVLRMDGTAPITQAYWNAKAWRPDGIISGTDLTKERLQEASVRGYSLRYPLLDQKIRGLRGGELTMIAAGSGVGKTSWVRELSYGLHQDHGLTIGNIFLEENVNKSGQAYVALHTDTNLADLRADPSILSEEQWDTALAETIHQRMYFYEHFGSLDAARLIAKIRYMRTVLKVDFVFLDHISIVISGQTSSSEGERKDIDILMTSLVSLAEETGIGIVAIVHLNAAEGKAHEEGGRVTLKNLRGSGSLKQLSHSVIALERDQQSTDTADQSDIRVLKCRETGDLGLADMIEFNRKTGRLVATPRPEPKEQPSDIPF